MHSANRLARLLQVGVPELGMEEVIIVTKNFCNFHRLITDLLHRIVDEGNFPSIGMNQFQNKLKTKPLKIVYSSRWNVVVWHRHTNLFKFHWFLQMLFKRIFLLYDCDEPYKLIQCKMCILHKIRIHIDKMWANVLYLANKNPIWIHQTQNEAAKKTSTVEKLIACRNVWLVDGKNAQKPHRIGYSQIDFNQRGKKTKEKIIQTNSISLSITFGRAVERSVCRWPLRNISMFIIS